MSDQNEQILRALNALCLELLDARDKIDPAVYDALRQRVIALVRAAT